METLPKFIPTPSLKGTSVKLSALDYYDLIAITKESGAPSPSQAVRLLLTAEDAAIQQGKRSPDSFIFSDDKRMTIVHLMLSKEDREIIDSLKEFYQVDSLTSIVTHLIRTYGRR